MKAFLLVAALAAGFLPLPVPAATDTATTGALADAMLQGMKAGKSLDAMLRQTLREQPAQALPAIAAAITVRPDQAANIVSTALDREFNLSPVQVAGTALEAAPERSAVIVPAAMVRSPGYYTLPIVQRAVATRVNAADFLPPSMRAVPYQADSMLIQVLRTAPYQTSAVMKAVITDQPQQTTHYVATGLSATKNASSVAILQPAFEVEPGQAQGIIFTAKAANVPESDISLACQQAGLGVEICGGEAIAENTMKTKPKTAGGLVGMWQAAHPRPVAAEHTPGVATGILPELEGHFNITPLAGYRVFGKDRIMDDGATIGVSVGYHYDAPFAVEARFISTRADAYLMTLNGLYFLAQGEHWSPYVMGQVGSSNFEDGQGYTERLAVGLGAGALYRLTPVFSLRAELGIVSYQPSSSDGVALIGLEISQKKRR